MELAHVAPRERARAAYTFILTIMLVLGISATRAAADDGFTVIDTRTQLENGVHRVYANISFSFSEEAIEAMENGVALTISIQMQVLRLSRVWDQVIADVKAQYRIQVHALSHQYVIKNLSTGESTTYPNLDEMSKRLGRIQALPLLDDHLLDADEHYRVRLRAALDRESLPTPLRLLAYFKSAWQLSSEWITWPLKR